MTNRAFFFGVLLLVGGVFGAENYDKIMSVMEGDPVTLNPGDTKIPEDDTIQWWFGDKFIAQMNKADNLISTSEGDDAGFKGRLKLDQTASLTITNIRNTESGLYKLLIKSTTETTMIFKVTVHEMKLMSVKDGDSVTLQFDTEIQRDDQILWMFGSTCIAEINKAADTHSVYEDVLGGIFRDRLKLDHQTGSLTITDTRTEHTGLYKVELTSSSRESKSTRFIVTLSSMEKYDMTVSVMEGDSVTLNPGDTKILEDDTIQWWFGDKIIAYMNKADRIISTSEGDDAGFKGRLQLDQTGSLTITNIRNTESGFYKLLIRSTTETTMTFKVTVRDYVESLSVMEGDSVTLYTNFPKIQRNDQIEWKFGDQVIPTHHLNSAVDASWENIHLNDETGDLTITNIRRDQSGDYEVEIKNSDNSLILHRKFRITSEMKFVSVMEGDSVTLQFYTEIQRDDQILWMFGPGSTRIAEINKAADTHSVYEDVLGGIFRGRLKLDLQTGSLTITDTRTEHTGLYNGVLTSSSSRGSKYTRFIVNLNYVESLSVMEGDSVTLYTNFPKIQRNDQIEWKFGDQVTLTGHLNSAVDASWESIHLNDETGDLTITNIRTDQSGDYEVEIKNSDNSLILHRKFRITLSGQDQINPKTPFGIIVPVLVLVMVVAIAGFVIYWKKYRQPRQNYAAAGEGNGLAKELGETEGL